MSISSKDQFIAIDLGASGGKMASATFDGETLRIKDYLSFPNTPVKIHQSVYWDVFDLYKSVISGLKNYGLKNGAAASVGIDSWGATYGFLDHFGRLLEPVYHYRDNRTKDTMKHISEKISMKALFEMTGCQCNRTYTLPQLYSSVLDKDTSLESADKMLLLPDLLGYFLSGETTTEMTIAGTTALLDSSQEAWSYNVFNHFSIPTHFLSPIVDAGTIKGKMTKAIAEETKIGSAKLIATVEHDSAAAVAAIPGFECGKLYISIGTNVSMGTMSIHPVISEKAYLAGFKNTGGFGRKKIVYRDFAAFWILNEMRDEWKHDGIDYSFDELHGFAETATSVHSYIDLESPDLNSFDGNMLEKMSGYFGDTKQKIPETVGEWTLCLYESIALRVKYYAESLSDVMSVDFSEAFIINGGSRNVLLDQLISDALQIPVKAGLPYATLVGNLLVQLYSQSLVSSEEQFREVAKKSFPMKEYYPVFQRDWGEELGKARNKLSLPWLN